MITAIVAFVIGAACFWISVKLILLFLKVRKWDRVEAKVLSKEIFLHPKYSSTHTPYGIKVEYAYSVNGEEYTGTNMNLIELTGGQVNYMKRNAEKQIQKIDSNPLIFVDLNDPTRSVLYCKGIGFYVVIFLMGILSCMIGLGALAD